MIRLDEYPGHQEQAVMMERIITSARDAALNGSVTTYSELERAIAKRYLNEVHHIDPVDGVPNPLLALLHDAQPVIDNAAARTFTNGQAGAKHEAYWPAMARLLDGNFEHVATHTINGSQFEFVKTIVDRPRYGQNPESWRLLGQGAPGFAAATDDFQARYPTFFEKPPTYYKHAASSLQPQAVSERAQTLAFLQKRVAA